MMNGIDLTVENITASFIIFWTKHGEPKSNCVNDEVFPNAENMFYRQAKAKYLSQNVLIISALWMNLAIKTCETMKWKYNPMVNLFRMDGNEKK